MVDSMDNILANEKIRSNDGFHNNVERAGWYTALSSLAVFMLTSDQTIEKYGLGVPIIAGVCGGLAVLGIGAIMNHYRQRNH